MRREFRAPSTPSNTTYTESKIIKNPKVGSREGPFQESRGASQIASGLPSKCRFALNGVKNARIGASINMLYLVLHQQAAQIVLNYLLDLQQKR